jgi:radical SAM superfamily enzyme YgiQ (UPF0313 family)
MSDSRRVVLYYPERGDPKLGQPYSADLMPLEFLHICAPAMEEGFTFDIIDSMVEPDPMKKLWEKLPGAMAFGSTCIVGYQVADGAEVAREVRRRHPKLPIIWGGWFPSVAPELFLRNDLADAVCLGQGELTFRDWTARPSTASRAWRSGATGRCTRRHGARSSRSTTCHRRAST